MSFKIEKIVNERADIELKPVELQNFPNEVPKGEAFGTTSRDASLNKRLKHNRNTIKIQQVTSLVFIAMVLVVFFLMFSLRNCISIENKCKELQEKINAQQVVINSLKNESLEFQSFLIQNASYLLKVDNYTYADAALSWAIEKGLINFVRFLMIQNGVNVNSRTTGPNGNSTPIITASWYGHIDIVQLLIEHKANVNEKDKNGDTALMIATKRGHKEIVRLLIENKANVNEKDENGDTDLMIASREGLIDIVQVLIENKANVNEKNNKGDTALTLASCYGHKYIVQLLIQNNASIEEKNIAGYSALIEASKWGHKEIVQLLIENEANVNEKNNVGDTALMWALRNGHKDIVQLLIDNKANVNEKDNDGDTALMIASMEEHMDIVQLLIEKGAADVNANNIFGRTALSNAKKQEI